MKRALLMSSSRRGHSGYLQHASEQIHHLFQHQPVEILFIPYAAVCFSFDEYEQRVKPVFNALGYGLTSIHHFADAKSAVAKAQAIAVGGGNTFALLKRLYDADLLQLISQQVNQQQKPYVGWSAGSNIANPGIYTTNDMPIVSPPDLRALHIIPFQTNPHFIAGKPAGHNGESREERLQEYMTINPGQPVLALYEGSALYVEDQHGTVLGEQPALWFKNPQETVTLPANTPFLLSHIANQ